LLLCRDEQGRIGTSTGLNAGHGRRSGEEMKGGAWHGRMASVGRVRDRWLTSTFRRASCLDVLDRAGDPALLVSNGHRQRHVVSLVMSKIVCLATR